MLVCVSFLPSVLLLVSSADMEVKTVNVLLEQLTFEVERAHANGSSSLCQF